MKKKILMALSLLAVAGLSIGGTVAYFKAQDTTVNTFTYGEVAIEQVQYERAVDENGNWISLTTKDKYHFYPEKIVEYTNSNKQLVPAVFADGNIKWEDREVDANATSEHRQSWGQIGAPGANALFDDSVKNVQDNFVFVKNTGTNDAYIRTWFAFEQGSLEVDEPEIKNGEIIWPGYKVEMNINPNHWHWEAVAKDVVIVDEEGNENTYIVMSATYLGPSSNKTGILASGTTSYLSLAQIYMKPETTKTDIDSMDGNGNKTFDLLIATQAVQTDGFVGLHATGLEDANNAFDKAFGTGIASSPFNIKNS